MFRKEKGPTQDQIQKLTQASIKQRKHYMLLGEVTSLILQSRLHHRYAIVRILTRTIPALKNNQFKIYYDKLKPVGYVSWAYISDEVEEKFKKADYDLKPDEWNCGDNLWFVEFVAIDGYATKFIDYLKKEVFADKIARSNRVDEQGQFIRHDVWKGINIEG